MIDFTKINSVHFIGIGGIGTSAIARMFLPEGKSVSGSDMAESEITELLKKEGAAISIGEDAKNIPEGTELVIYTIAIDKDNAELLEAKKRDIPTLSYPEALGIISKDKYTIAVVGTHGKTTTTAMIAKVLMDAGLDPTVIIGSLIFDKDGKRTNFISGKGDYLVVEGCEYCRSFLNISPRMLVITNIDADHLDYYRDMEDIISAFVELSQKLPKDGYLILDSHSQNVEAVVKNSPCQNGDYAALRLPEGFKLHIPGSHNLLNAKAALGVAKILNISDASALSSLEAFRGTWRRFEYRGRAKNKAFVYDDYGHHPTEIEATLQGTRERFPDKKITVVFQPHLYSRTKQHLQGFGKALSEASSVILLPIYPAREVDPGDISSEMVAEEIKKNGKDAEVVQTFEEAASLAEKLSKEDDLILTLGAGDTNKVADILVRKVESS